MYKSSDNSQSSDRELVEQITENPYLQYFIGLPGYQEEPPFDASTLVLFRKRINAQMIAEVNEYILSNQNKKDDDDDLKPPTGGGTPDDAPSNSEPDNKGTLILDATCAPVNIWYPQDVSLLNEAREKLETIIYRFHKSYGLPLPRRYSKRVRKDYLAFAKCKKDTAKKIRKALRQQLSYVKRNIGYLDKFMADGYRVQNLAVLIRSQAKQINNWNIRITRIELQLSVNLARKNDAMDLARL